MIRNIPGKGVRQKYISVIAWAIFLMGVALGLCGGVMLYWVMGTAGWEAWPAITTGVAVLLMAVVVWRSKVGSWSWETSEKGIEGEKIVGGTIQDALMRPDCAVVHSIPGRGERGEIDHLVVTPTGVWVVETKYSWVPKKRYRQVMRRLALNVRSLRRDLGPGANVRGCLVLAKVRRRKRSVYNARGEELNVFSVRSFREQVRAEAATQGRGNEAAVRAVLKMVA